MSSSDVERLERFLTRELKLTRENNSKDHEYLRDELVKLDAKIDGIAARLNHVEDENAAKRARADGRSRFIVFLSRAFVQIVTVIAAIVGAVAVSEHWFK